MTMSMEEVISARPLVIRRRVRWGECDAAGVVYTVRFGDYALSATWLFQELVLDQHAAVMARGRGPGMPIRHLEYDFRRSLWPDEFFDMTVRVAEIRSRAFTLDINGRLVTGEDAFTAKVTPICVDQGTRTSIAIPPAMRDALEAYRSATAESDPSRAP